MTEDVKPAESKPADKPVEAASAAPGEKRSAGRPRKEPAAAPKIRASESGDAAVHKALADLQTAQMNQAAAKAAAEQSDEQGKGHDEAVADAQKALADLGYE